MPDKKTEKGKSAVVVAMADAERVLDRKRGLALPGTVAEALEIGARGRDLHKQKRRRADPAPDQPRNGILANRKNEPPNWRAGADGLPVEDPCPVTCLGIDGKIKHFIDSAGQFVSYDKLTHDDMQHLFMVTPHWPQFHFPRYGRSAKVGEGEKPKAPPIETFDDDDVRTHLYHACSHAGPFRPRDQLRGLGAWTLPGGQMLYHAGDELWVHEGSGKRPVPLATGFHHGFLYPRMPALPPPWPEPLAPEDGPAGALLQTYRMWNWERPAVDPVLLLGHNMVGYGGGALDWRSAILLLGGFGTGKSELQRGLQQLFGAQLLPSAETSAAGIYQDMAHDTRLVAIDEQEPDNERTAQLIKLMRIAASGNFSRRGSAGGAPVSYQLRCSFLFSAINNPLHDAQDVSRVAILRLMPLSSEQTQAPAIDEHASGRMLLAILMREWPRFMPVRALYMDALREGGHSPRGQKTYGTLLALADLALGTAQARALGVPLISDPDEARSAQAQKFWIEHLSAAAVPEAEYLKENWASCLDAIIGSPVPQWRGGAHHVVSAVLGELSAGGKIELHEARRALQSAGLNVLPAGEAIDKLAKAVAQDGGSAAAELAKLGLSSNDGYLLAIPHTSKLLPQLLADTPWARGGWMDALRQCGVGGLMLTDKRINRVMINGKQERCTLVVMNKVHELGEK